MQRGSNSAGVRRYNERLVLATVRRLNGASKADIAKATGLSPQAAVRIVDSLEEAGKLVRFGRRTGGLGQPAVVYRIDADGGCTIGVEIGRDRLTCLLLDFEGAVLSGWSRKHDFPCPDDVVEDIAAFSQSELARLSPGQRESFLGTGIAMPWFIGAWREELEISNDRAEAWQSADIEEQFRAGIGGPVYFENDGNAGALVELFCGAGRALHDFLYVHIGHFVGGGLVLGGQLHRGRHGNAAALASMPVPGGSESDVLLHRASLYKLRGTGWSGQSDDELENWLTECAQAMSFVVMGANSLLDLEAVIVGGALDHVILSRLIEKIRADMADHPPKDFFQPALLLGTVAENAGARGAGLLPMFASFTPDLAALLK